ncbi:MFS transporter [Aeromicrobium sp. 636]|uniref:MFS transporter n=1 Tax=Aeromicrobium senzhongii TaxID=2663859 RepID=A0A8I0EVY0_9ACTN|nr:MFS transporter [Aeromicrobium sp. 636]MBC9226519.1 MFS transporter [Aeromicrobium senzhongii]MCQ3998622.1 MFS transporter [Aeromicrobium sp. 636]
MTVSTSSPTTIAQPPEAPRRSAALIVATLSLCGIVVSLQQTLLLPLLPMLPDLLDASADSTSWLVTATLLTGAIATPTVTRLADMYGKRRMMVLTLAISVLGSILGAFSEDLVLLIVARALQGVGMAVVPVGIAIMRDELPRERIPLGVALMSATLAIGAGVGLPLSGLISEHLDWHAIFWATGAVGIALLIAAMVVLPESPVRTRGSFDFRGALLLSAALTALMLALSKGSHWGWSSPTTLGLVAGGGVLLAIWVPVELRTPSPLVDLRVSSRRSVVLVNSASVLVGFAMFANMLLTTQLLQMPEASGYGLGLGILETGWWMVPNAAAFGLMAPVSAWLTRRFGPQVTALSGALLMGVAYAARVFLSDDLAQVVIGSVAVGVGTAMVYGALPTMIMRAVPVTETASANGLNVLLRSIGTTSASAIVAAVTSASVVTIVGEEATSEGAIRLLFWLAAAAALVGAAVLFPTLGMQDFAPEADRSGTATSSRPNCVVHGKVVDANARPVRNAVVTVLTMEGAAVDWGHADSEGQVAVAVPGHGDYFIVTSADGWQPRSRIVTVDVETGLPPLVLRDRLTLEGTITDADGVPIEGVLVILTHHAGEVVTSTRTDHEGRYAVPRPPNGRYVLSAICDTGATGARPVTVWEANRTADLTLGTPLA